LAPVGGGGGGQAIQSMLPSLLRMLPFSRAAMLGLSPPPDPVIDSQQQNNTGRQCHTVQARCSP
jgi:hypothetical protein